MKILAVGGGSGGHVTPVVAVLKEIKDRYPDAEMRFWTDRAFAAQARRLIGHFDDSVYVGVIASGKLRRYHHLKWWQQLVKLQSIVVPNIVDGIKVAVGVLQSVYGLLVWRPDVVFAKGGYVCLPVGVAAHLLKIPLVIHDSDAHPGLTNRVLSRWASRIGTGAPLKFYPYPASISRYVGVPVVADFAPFSRDAQIAAKQTIGVDATKPLVVVTGGGLGARRLNVAVARQLDQLLPLMNIVLISGEREYDEMRALTPQDDPRFQLHAFVSNGMATLLGAADIVVARAGATTILELAALAKPTILVPNGFLTGGHQLKNAAVYAENGAVSVLDELELEKRPELLTDELTNILADHKRMQHMAEAFHSFAHPDAAAEMASLIIAAIKK